VGLDIDCSKYFGSNEWYQQSIIKVAHHVSSSATLEHHQWESWSPDQRLVIVTSIYESYNLLWTSLFKMDKVGNKMGTSFNYALLPNLFP
jgi:hypothetical protein